MIQAESPFLLLTQEDKRIEAHLAGCHKIANKKNYIIYSKANEMHAKEFLVWYESVNLLMRGNLEGGEEYREEEHSYIV